MFVGGGARACNGACTVGSVALVVVGLNFSAVGLVRVVHRVVKRDDLWVVGAVVVVKVVKAHVKAVNARVDDGHGDALAGVPGLLLSKVDLVNDGHVAVLNLENTVELKHHDARECSGLQDHGVRDSPGNGIDEREFPFVDVPDLSLEHGNVLLRGGVVKVNDERQRVGFVQKQRVVVVFLHHVGNLVAVLVHVGGLPPRFAAA